VPAALPKLVAAAVAYPHEVGSACFSKCWRDGEKTSQSLRWVMIVLMCVLGAERITNHGISRI